MSIALDWEDKVNFSDLQESPQNAPTGNPSKPDGTSY
jgi:hypothetical protein